MSTGKIYSEVVSALNNLNSLRLKLHEAVLALPYEQRLKEVMALYWRDTRHVFTNEELRKMLGQSPAAFNRLVEMHKPAPPKPAVNVNEYAVALLEGFAARGQRPTTLDMVLATIELNRNHKIGGRERVLFEEALDVLIAAQRLQHISATPGGNGLYAVVQ